VLQTKVGRSIKNSLQLLVSNLTHASRIDYVMVLIFQFSFLFLLIDFKPERWIIDAIIIEGVFVLTLGY